MKKSGFLPTTIAGWCAKKRLFMRLLSEEPDPEQREVYEHAINYCDRKVAQAAKALLVMVVLVNVLMILSVFATSCGTLAGLQSDLHQITRSSMVERGQ